VAHEAALVVQCVGDACGAHDAGVAHLAAHLAVERRGPVTDSITIRAGNPGVVTVTENGTQKSFDSRASGIGSLTIQGTPATTDGSPTDTTTGTTTGTSSTSTTGSSSTSGSKTSTGSTATSSTSSGTTGTTKSN
jgi:hypothetical protein